MAQLIPPHGGKGLTCCLLEGTELEAEKKKAAGLNGKVTLPGADDVKNYTGYAPGAVCPFLLPERLPVLLDQSLQRFEMIYPAAATGSSAVALTFSRLKELCGGRIVDVCDIEDLTDARKE